MYPAYPQIGTNIWNLDFPFQYLTACQRCGQGHFHAGQCKALNRKCYKCGTYGHYGQFCQRTASRNNPGTKQKSQRRKQRDIQRYCNFKERKSLCAELPFYSIETSEIVDLMPNWKTVRILELEDECDRLFNLAENFQDRVEIEEMVHNETKSKLDSALQEKLDLQEKVLKLSTKVTELQSANAEHQQKLCDAQKQLEQVTIQRDEVFMVYHKSKKTLDKLKNYNKAVRHEFTKVVSSMYKSEIRPQHPACRRCGSTARHRHTECAAYGNVCANCRKKNHLTVFCEIETWVSLDKHVLDIVNYLEDVLIN